MRYNRKTVDVVTAPAALAVSVADVKTYLRVDTNDDDDLIEDFIGAATESVKQYLRRSLITETLELTMDGFSHVGDERLLSLGAGVHDGSRSYYLGRPNEVELPFLPIQSVSSVKTYSTTNTESTFSASNYELDETGGRLYLNEGVSWPDNLRAREAVKIEYVAGYGDSGSDIPSPIIQAIKKFVAAMYECREACGMPDVCKSFLAPYKICDNLGYS